MVRGGNRAAETAGTHVRFIAVALRTHSPVLARDVARTSLEFWGQGLSGFDMAGVEVEAPDPSIFGDAVEVARAGGLGITCHAGEWGGAAQVWRALELEFRGASHTVRRRLDDPELMAELTERDVTLDICPTSNLQAGVGTADHAAPCPTPACRRTGHHQHR